MTKLEENLQQISADAIELRELLEKSEIAQGREYI